MGKPNYDEMKIEVSEGFKHLTYETAKYIKKPTQLDKEVLVIEVSAKLVSLLTFLLETYNEKTGTSNFDNEKWLLLHARTLNDIVLCKRRRSESYLESSNSQKRYNKYAMFNDASNSEFAEEILYEFCESNQKLNINVFPSLLDEMAEKNKKWEITAKNNEGKKTIKMYIPTLVENHYADAKAIYKELVTNYSNIFFEVFHAKFRYIFLKEGIPIGDIISVNSQNFNKINSEWRKLYSQFSSALSELNKNFKIPPNTDIPADEDKKESKEKISLNNKKVSGKYELTKEPNLYRVYPANSKKNFELFTKRMHKMNCCMNRCMMSCIDDKDKYTEINSMIKELKKTIIYKRI